MAYKGVERRKFVRFDYPLFVQYKIVEKASREEVLSSISLHMKEILEKWDKRGYDKEKLRSSLIREMRNFSFTKNIGEGGICLITREKFKPDTLLRIQIYIPTRKEPIEVLAKVSWVKKRILRPGYNTGVSFVEIKETDRDTLSAFLHLFSQVKFEDLT